ncbi:hypothetical protein BB559_003051 [Furculomyces boomerangus]|uniref:CoA-binding domain-containing protein n=1 Tax=Furculomyces boomerangus TaxID=61424 RepID=A0A2T9YPJ2_9FUNG|nr:hypothetical protein BB559_003051 [Furculomyces boomerangus]
MQAAFFAKKIFAVAGASNDPSKFGNIILKAYINKGLNVIPINPRGGQIEGLDTVTSLSQLIDVVNTKYGIKSDEIGLSVVTPPKATQTILENAASLEIRNIWLQPGSEPENWKKTATELKLNIIGGGPCVLVSGHL